MNLQIKISKARHSLLALTLLMPSQLNLELLGGQNVKNIEVVENVFNKQTKNDLVDLVKGIIPGLYNLKTTYNNSEKGSDGEKEYLEANRIEQNNFIQNALQKKIPLTTNKQPRTNYPRIRSNS